MVNPAAQRSRHLAPGGKLGKYEVIRQIAIGGMAELYLARTSGIEGFEKLVVIKRILPQYVSNASFVEMFLNEARIAATLHHANIAQVYDIGVDEGDYFFAMEYVHGEDLDHISMASEEQGVPISLDAALTLVAGLCAGLHYAHEKANADGRPLQIVHRDVSPSNVLVSYDGSVKVVDFGIARASSRASTTHGGIKGKIAYMSPEQCKAGGPLDRRSDIYAIGTILYELSTGQLPFSGETEYQILNQIVNDDAPRPSAIVPSYPSALERIVMRALARNVDQRYPTALELQSDVEDFAHEMRLRTSPLVLARLMGTLFPARLEEWDHAKAQGAFFVEQHVVRTLIESGKTPDPELRAALAAAMACDAEAEAEPTIPGDDDATTVTHSFGDHSDTAIDASPVSHTGSLPIPPPPPTGEHVLQSPPEPRRPRSYPSVSDLMTATPGSLVTSTTSYGSPVERIDQVVDVTERVRVKRQSSPTTFVRAPSKKPWLALAGAVAIAGGIAVFIITRGEDAPKRATPAEIATPPLPSEPTVEPLPSAAPPAEAPARSIAEKTKRVEPKSKPELKKVTAKSKKVEAKAEPKPEPKPEPKKSEAKPEPKVEPKPAKEPSWDTDSPFMPVRSDKH